MIVSPLAHKALRDVSRRKLRTLLVVIGIVVGVAGLTAINVASHELAAAFAYSATERATPDISVSADQVDPSLAAAAQSLPNVRVVQLMTFYSTRWKISAPPGHVNMRITAYQDLNRVAIYPFEVTSGRLPRLGEIVMESSDRTLQPFKVGDAITIRYEINSIVHPRRIHVLRVSPRRRRKIIGLQVDNPDRAILAASIVAPLFVPRVVHSVGDVSAVGRHLADERSWKRHWRFHAAFYGNGPEAGDGRWRIRRSCRLKHDRLTVRHPTLNYIRPRMPC